MMVKCEHCETEDIDLLRCDNCGSWTCHPCMMLCPWCSSWACPDCYDLETTNCKSCS